MAMKPFLVIAISFLSLARAHTENSDVQQDLVENGQVHIATLQNADDIPGIRGHFLVRGERECVYSQIKDIEFFKESYRNIEELVVLKELDDGAELELTLNVIIKRITYTVERTHDDEEFLVIWHKTGGDLDYISGLWDVEESRFPNRCLVIYESYVKPKGPFPVKLYRWLALQQARSNLSKLQRLLDETCSRH